MMKRILVALGIWLIGCVAAPAQNPVDVPTAARSASITTGNTYQTLLAATTNAVDSNRKSLTIQNNNTNGDNCWIEVGGLIPAGSTVATNVTTLNGTITAVKASVLLGAGGSYQRYYPYIPSGPVVGTCATTGDSLYVDTQ